MSKPTDNSADTAEDEGDAPTSKRRKMMLLVGIGLSVLALGAGGWFGFTASRSHAPAAKEAAADQGHGAAAKDAGGHGTGDATAGGNLALLDFQDLVVNVAGSSATGTATQRIMRIRFAMAYADPEKNAHLIEQKQPYLRDAILSYLRQLHEADLRGSDGLFLLKAELLKRARAVVGSDAPKEFLITDLVMQ